MTQDARRLIAGPGDAVRSYCSGRSDLVMPAGTDAGSVVMAAQSRASWGHRLVLPQLLLIPVLYLVQEITVRLECPPETATAH